MKKYEALFVIDPEKEGALDAIKESIAASISKSKGAIDSDADWGKQRLSHAIDKRPDGIYYKLDFTIDPSEIKVLNNTYKLNQDILRVMITAKPE